MDVKQACVQLQKQGQMIMALINGLNGQEFCWKPNPESWSVLEVLGHLVDEEELDFRCHLDHILHTPDQPWPEIDPMGWVTERRYNEQDPDVQLINFSTAREQSIIWLASLPQPNFNASITLPWGALTAGDMLASWLAHDLLHLRQLVELRYAITAEACLPYRLDYAGKW